VFGAFQLAVQVPEGLAHAAGITGVLEHRP